MTVMADSTVLAVSVSLKLKLVRIKPCPPALDDAAFEAKVSSIIDNAGFDVVADKIETKEVYIANLPYPRTTVCTVLPPPSPGPGPVRNIL